MLSVIKAILQTAVILQIYHIDKKKEEIGIYEKIVTEYKLSKFPACRAYARFVKVK